MGLENDKSSNENKEIQDFEKFNDEEIKDARQATEENKKILAEFTDDGFTNDEIQASKDATVNHTYSAVFHEDAKLEDIKKGNIKLYVTPIYKNEKSKDGDGLETGETKTIDFI